MKYKTDLYGFWQERYKINKDVTIPAVYNRFCETGRFKAFNCDWKEGQEQQPHFFWDSDVAKWLEAAAYVTENERNPSLEAIVDDIVDKIEKNRHKDGYFNIYYTVVEPGNRFTKRDNHELYCLGHLTEAAVAYSKATGKDKFLSLIEDYLSLVNRIFITDKTALFSTPGHEELELALAKIYEYTGNEKYLDMLKYFIEQRGKCKDDIGTRTWTDSFYDQTDLPVRELKTARGHSVRACYLYSGMADLARLTDDESLFNACDELFDDIANGKMYITGGIGSSAHGEMFTEKYDLPPRLAYSETCASIALALFAKRMSEISPNSKYDDVAERAVYNCVLAGVSLKGDSFFYVNPLEIDINKTRCNNEYRKSNEKLLSQRVEVFSCSCCPPNIVRFIASISDFLYSKKDNDIFIHHYMGSKTEIDNTVITQVTDYPNSGEIKFTVVDGVGKTLRLRVPDWCSKCLIDGKTVTANSKGFVTVDVTDDNFSFSVDFNIEPFFVKANPQVSDYCGEVCLQRGPLVYCIEKNSNNDISLNKLSVDTESDFCEIFDNDINAYTIKLNGFKEDDFSSLYRKFNKTAKEKIKLKFIPYFAFANNGESDMKVWVRY